MCSVLPCLLFYMHTCWEMYLSMNELAEKCVDGSEVTSVMMLLISSGLVSHITPYKADIVPVLLCGKIEHNSNKMFSCLQWTDLFTSSLSMYFGTLCVKDPNYAQVWCAPTQKCVETFSILGLCWRTKINEIHKCNKAMSEAKQRCSLHGKMIHRF